MKIVVVSPFSPFPPYWGGGARIYNLVRKISQNCETTLIYNDVRQVIDAVDDDSVGIIERAGVSVERIKPMGRASQFFHPLMFNKMLRLLKKDHPDYVICEFLWSSAMIGLACKICGVPMVLDEHNVEHVRLDRMGKVRGVAAKGLEFFERFGIGLSALTLCVSNIDKEQLILMGINEQKIFVLPNAVDVDLFTGKEASRNETRRSIDCPGDVPMILFHGKLDYAPNRDAIDIIIKEIVPRLRSSLPDFRIVLAGSNPPRDLQLEKEIIVTGIYRDLPALLASSDVIICPLRIGGGTRIKIIEALFAGRWVVSTPIGAEGIDADETDGLLKIADNWDAMVSQVMWCLDEGRSEPKLPEKFIMDHNWKDTVSKLCQVLESMR